jgi:hypothetical protein
MDKFQNKTIFVLKVSMTKIPIPKKQELLEFIMEELRENDANLSGDIEGFSKNLYKSFRRYIRGKEYKDKLFYEFAFHAVDTLLLNNVPSQSTDSFSSQRPAGE